MAEFIMGFRSLLFRCVFRRTPEKTDGGSLYSYRRDDVIKSVQLTVVDLERKVEIPLGNCHSPDDQSVAQAASHHRR